MRTRTLVALSLLLLPLSLQAAPAARPRVRDLGLAPGVLPPGAQNAITDVAGCGSGTVR